MGQMGKMDTVGRARDRGRDRGRGFRSASAPARRAETRRRRAAAIAPLFAYCAEHGVSVAWIGQRAALRVGVTTMSRTRLCRIKQGEALVPDWFVEGMCRELEQPVEVVMGREWRQRHLLGSTTTTSSEAGDEMRAETHAETRQAS